MFLNKKIKYITNTIISRYRNMAEPIKASAWFLICNILVKGFAMLSTPIYTRLLTTEQYGQSAAYYSWHDLLYSFMTLGITGVAYNNVLAKYEDDRDNATLSLMGLTSASTGVAFAIYILGRNYWSNVFQISTFMMCCMFIQFLFEPIFDFWSAKERYNYKYKRLVALTLFNAIASLVIGIASVLNTSYRYEARVISNVMVIFFTGITLYFITLKKVAFKITTKYWKYALRISIPLIPHYLSIKILGQADRVMISKMVGLSETGLYSLAYTLSLMMNMLTDAINKSLVPYTYKGIKKQQLNQVRIMINSVVSIVLLACILLMLAAPEIIKIFATEKYLDAVWIIPPVSLSVYFTFLYVIFSNVEFYFENTKLATISSGFAAILNIVLNYFFIKKCGYYAAGYTTLVCYIVLAVVHYLIFEKVKRQHPEIKEIYDIRFIGKISIAGIVIMSGCLFFYRYVFIRWGCVGGLIAGIVAVLRHTFKKNNA